MAKKDETLVTTTEDKKPVKKAKSVKEKAKKPNKVGKWFRELGVELKKVTWPKGGVVVKQTSVVLGVTLFFMVIVSIIDLGLGWLYKLLISGFSV